MEALPGMPLCHSFVGPQALSFLQIFGASLTILGGVMYGKARQAIEEEERKSLLPKGAMSPGKEGNV